jgi:hypothetical protein
MMLMIRDMSPRGSGSDGLGADCVLTVVGIWGGRKGFVELFCHREARGFFFVSMEVSKRGVGRRCLWL